MIRMQLLFAFLLNFLFTSAQSKFRVIADKSIVALDDYIRIQFHLDNTPEVTSFTPPVFTDFVKVQGPEQITGQLTINGSVNHYTAFSYVLKPVKKGRFIIPPAKATVEGKLIQSPSLSITVNDHGAPRIPLDPEDDQPESLDEFILKKNESAAKKIQQNVFVRLEVNKKSVYVGEPLVATYKLYTRLNSESRITRRPSLNGFSVVDMVDPESRDVYHETYRGRDYNVYILRKAQLYPLQEGKFELEPMDVENTVSFIRSEYASDEYALWRKLKTLGEEGLGPDAWSRETVNLSSEPVAIDVRPLPAAKGDSGYNGAVGVFTVSAEIPPQKIRQGDVVNLQVTVSGSGNLPLLGIPEIAWPESFETYDVRIREQLNNGSSPVSGKKIFTIPFSPKKTGRMDLPAVSLTSFNPVTAKYSTSQTKPITIDVLPAINKPASKLHAVKKALQSSPYIPVTWMAAGLFILMAAVFISFRLYRKRKTPLKPFPEKQAISVALTQAPILPAARIILTPDKARMHMENAEPVLFYKALHNVIREMLFVQFNISRLDNPETVESRLKKIRVSKEDAASIRTILEDCELSSYSPVVLDEKVKDDFEKTVDLMQRLQELQPANR